MTMSDLKGAYIQPSYSFSESSAVYLKIGYIEAETSVTGDVTKPADLTGTTIAIGSKSLFPNPFGFFENKFQFKLDKYFNQES
mgnify:CR=1 FL=1